MSGPLPPREIARGCAMAFGILVIVAAPVVFVVSLPIFLGHGDEGAIWNATTIAVVVGLVGLALAIAAAQARPGRGPGDTPPADPDGTSTSSAGEGTDR